MRLLTLSERQHIGAATHQPSAQWSVTYPQVFLAGIGVGVVGSFMVSAIIGTVCNKNTVLLAGALAGIATYVYYNVDLTPTQVSSKIRQQ